MSQTTQLMFACVSHSPLIVVRKRKPEVEERILSECAAFRAKVESFAPAFIIFFSNDHFASFHYSNMPAYCVGAAAEAVADVGGTAGTIPVPAETAIALVDHLRRADFDPAISYRMKVDHGFSQPLTRLLGGVDRWPLIPIFISAFTRPLIPLRRSRLFGAAVGRFVASCGQRVLIMGSGGISHHPARYYPMPQDADPAVYAWQLDGPAGGSMTEEQWFARLDQMHREGAQMVIDGSRTVADMRLNADFDKHFLAHIAAERLDDMDDWDQAGIVAKAGVGALEIHNWIAALAAYVAAGGGAVTTRYDLVPEYAVGYAFARSA